MTLVSGSVLAVPVMARAAEEELPECRTSSTVAGWDVESSVEYCSITREIPIRTGEQVSAPGISNIEQLRPEFKFVNHGLEDNQTNRFLYLDVPRAYRVDGRDYVLVGSNEDQPAGIAPKGKEFESRKAMGMFVFVDGDRELAHRVTDISGMYDDKTMTLELRLDRELDARLRDGDVADIYVKDAKSEIVGKQEYLVRAQADISEASRAWEVAWRGMDRATERKRAGECKESSCFITTACCACLGRADDCWELRTLRRFRDEVLLARPDGAAVVAEYYATAPAVLAALPDRGPRRALELLRLYFGMVLPCALLARLQRHRAARRRYERCFRRLRWRWLGNRPVQAGC